MKTLFYHFLLLVFLLGCTGADTEPAPGLTKEDVEFGDNKPVIDDIQYTMTNNGVAPTTITFTAKSRYAGGHSWWNWGASSQQQTKSVNETFSITAPRYGPYSVVLLAFRNEQALKNYQNNKPNDYVARKVVDIQVKPGTVTLTNKTAFSTDLVQFGGKSYCTYSGRFTEGKLTFSRLEDNTFIGAALSARYIEAVVGSCPYAPTTSNVHTFELTGSPVRTANNLLYIFETKTGTPKYRATYASSPSGEYGSIYFERIDEVAKNSPLFKAAMTINTVRLEP